MRTSNTFVILILALTVLLVPLLAITPEKSETKPASATFVSEKAEIKATKPVKKAVTVRVLQSDTEKIVTLPIDDYIFGVVAGEIPLTYNIEAVKAQIVAAKTYTLFRISNSSGEKYDISTDSETSQNYITPETARKNWGENAENYEKTLKDAIAEVIDYVITYDNKPIQAVYHAISAGYTESGKNVWGSDVKYLQPTESVADKLADGYLSETEFSVKQVDTLLKNTGFTAKTLSSGKCTKSESGNILKITNNNKSITGGELARIFSLRSQNFDIKTENSKIKFTVRGYGHQAGMSQNGANYMAKCGNDFITILKHYYKGVKVEKQK